MTIEVAMVGDQGAVRERLSAVLATQADIQVVGEADSGARAIALMREREPDIVLLDIALSGMDATAMVRLLKQAARRTKLIALSEDRERRAVDRMLATGAMGYVVKSTAADEVVPAIRAVAAGGVWISPEISFAHRQDAAKHKDEPPLEVLGRREQEVLARLAEGKRSAEIAAELRISVATVEVHRRNIMSKLGLRSVAQLTRYAIRKGLTPL
jgi:DNA-binding NarL/FixJ family response regulator